ncbi:MAG: 6,7-dimethyl-8-ribityllumazine synthase [Acidimicrobiales bacterium]
MDLHDFAGIRGSQDGTGLRVAIVCSRFNGEVTGRLLEGTLVELDRSAVTEADRTVVWVPGAFELPLAAMALARTRQYDAVICLGAVIRGETSHYDFVAGECAAGLQRVQLEMNLPVVFGVLTTENLEQALARSGGAVGNKGTEAAMTAIEMANVLRQLESARPGMADSASGTQRQ